jgi:hypothetical protein
MGDSVKKHNEGSGRRLYPGDITITDTTNALYPDTTFTPKTDKYVQRVKDNFEQRSQTGIEKYGTTLERKDVDLLGWLTHLQEELMDATLYIERLKDETTKNS